MYSYTIIQWLFFFYFYCFFGWCFESCYVSLKSKRWVNRGFMKGPFLPLYGSVYRTLVGGLYCRMHWCHHSGVFYRCGNGSAVQGKVLGLFQSAF